MSAGPTRSDVRLLTEAFTPGEEVDRFTRAHPAAGGIVSFLGQVRAGGGVEALELQHYEPLTLPAMEELAAQVRGRWALDGLLILHRSGEMAPADPIVLVAAAARHRRDAFAAADFAMDHLKSQSWFWKREKVGGTWRWIEPREEDFEDIARWDSAVAGS
ncbi:molybdenum cofactor biosynthesis protein MoaE [Novosphingobium profundi]|uniref:molybdenum cofactor biosynthesis protein MoaE n=1 Tax=Novosphingobium profundi TaxID=1774954 RepID=UPI001CFEE134|nr:molybdenum cofactor biosynthesis protein MoaE [Novosphingobium profundi]